MVSFAAVDEGGGGDGGRGASLGETEDLGDGIVLAIVADGDIGKALIILRFCLSRKIRVYLISKRSGDYYWRSMHRSIVKISLL